MKHKNPGASNIFPHKNSNSEETKRIGTPKSSETKRPTINIDEDYTISTDYNAMSTGPIEISNNAKVTIPNNSTCCWKNPEVNCG